MRKYKYRGKGMSDNEWYFGDLIQTKLGTTWIITEDYTTATEEISLNTCASPQVKAETVGQFTSLYDKNGKEIYEGDILQIDIERTWVMWNEKYGYFELVPIGDYYFDSPVIGQAIEYTDATVIGNIYDNKELLNETN